MAQAVPEGFHTVTPHLVIRGAARALDFSRDAFGARERLRMPGPNGTVLHAEIEVGDSIVFLGDEFPGANVTSPNALEGSCCVMNLYVEDADALFDRLRGPARRS
jgi:uncharacterized glyoxalase superfamily protein PhnB